MVKNALDSAWTPRGLTKLALRFHFYYCIYVRNFHFTFPVQRPRYTYSTKRQFVQAY